MTTDAELREAVARAIYEKFPRIQAPESQPPQWGACKPRYQILWLKRADAALAAIRAAGYEVRRVG